MFKLLRKTQIQRKSHKNNKCDFFEIKLNQINIERVPLFVHLRKTFFNLFNVYVCFLMFIYKQKHKLNRFIIQSNCFSMEDLN